MGKWVSICHVFFLEVCVLYQEMLKSYRRSDQGSDNLILGPLGHWPVLWQLNALQGVMSVTEEKQTDIYKIWTSTNRSRCLLCWPSSSQPNLRLVIIQRWSLTWRFSTQILSQPHTSSLHLIYDMMYNGTLSVMLWVLRVDQSPVVPHRVNPQPQ